MVVVVVSWVGGVQTRAWGCGAQRSLGHLRPERWGDGAGLDPGIQIARLTGGSGIQQP